MVTSQFLTRALVGLSGLRYKLQSQQRAFIPPKRACILLPTGFREILGALSFVDKLAEAFPTSRFDWIIANQYRPLIASNKHINMLFSADPVVDHDVTLGQLRGLAARLRTVQYDTCFIPSRSPLLSYLAVQAEIPQRIGLNDQGRAVGLTFEVPANHLEPPAMAADRLFQGLNMPLPNAVNRSGFLPGDQDRDTITKILIDEIGWESHRSLIILAPGGNRNGHPLGESNIWPLERYVLLGNHLIRKTNACILVVGNQGDDESLCKDATGLVVGKVFNLSGRLTWGEVGALCELASLFIGNDSDYAQLANSVHCPTVVILGEENEIFLSPFKDEQSIHYLSAQNTPAFDWEQGVSVQDVTTSLEENKLL